MLTRQLAIARIERGQVLPDRLTSRLHAPYVAWAEEMIAVYRAGVGRSRGTLHRDVEKILERDPDCPRRRIDAFCKLLDDWSEYHRGRPQQTAKLRRDVFRMAASFHPLVERPEALWENRESEVKAAIAQRLGTDWIALKSRLYADLIENHVLRAFQPPERPQDLLSRYNVAQVQAALLDAVSVRIDASRDWKVILRQAKLAGLMHRITKTSGGYRFEFDGAASILRSTHRYGAAMAKFLPSLLPCRGWTMTATMRHRGRGNGAAPGGVRLELSDRSGLRGAHAPPEEFDSQWERQFQESWDQAPRAPWRLTREGAILHRGQRVFLPDFVIEHTEGRSVYLEIAGFWTPEYVAHRGDVLQVFSEAEILVAIPKIALARWASVTLPPKHRKLIFTPPLSAEAVLTALADWD